LIEGFFILSDMFPISPGYLFKLGYSLIEGFFILSDMFPISPGYSLVFLSRDLEAAN